MKLSKSSIVSHLALTGALIASTCLGSAVPAVMAQTRTAKTQTTTLSKSGATSWTTVYDGYGTVNWNSTFTELTMSPKAATQPSETHAALVINNQALRQPFQLSYTMKTTKQLRTGSTPNPWEVAWGVFGYKTDGKFKYFILKPNGLELGESLLNLAQNFLYTSSSPFPINTDYNVTMTAISNVITLKVNGRQYLQYALSGKDQLTLDGKFGFYTEDASVKIWNIVAKQL